MHSQIGKLGITSLVIEGTSNRTGISTCGGYGNLSGFPVSRNQFNMEFSSSSSSSSSSVHNEKGSGFFGICQNNSLEIFEVSRELSDRILSPEFPAAIPPDNLKSPISLGMQNDLKNRFLAQFFLPCL